MNVMQSLYYYFYYLKKANKKVFVQFLQTEHNY